VTVWRAGAACAALAAFVALPLLVFAAPPQKSAAGVILPAGTSETLVLDQSIDSASTQPGATIAAHLRDAIVLRSTVLAPAGATVHLLVAETRRAGAGASGEVFLRVEPLQLAGGITLPLQLVYPSMTPLLVAANPSDIRLPHERAKSLKAGTDLVLPPGTLLSARTAATLDASSPNRTVVQTPPPYTYSTEEPYAAYTPIPLSTLNPYRTAPPRKRGGKARPTASPSPSSSPSPSPTPSPLPT